ncbi:MAG: TrmB family transcriptional regulator [Halobacteriales archaeon]
MRLPPDLASPQSKLVYLSIAHAGPVTPRELKDHLDLPLISILGVLRRLDATGVVATDGDRYVLT